jgi:cytochrome c peroxidase
MKFIVGSGLLVAFCLLHFSFKEIAYTASGLKVDSLRNLYERPVAQWPKPNVDSGVVWQEFKALPAVGKEYFVTMAQPEVVLGKTLFFDPILSGSNQISCSSCHNPQTSWGDKISVPVGNDHLAGTRNSISLLNVKDRPFLFWDGRATTLEEQAISPIEAHNEMAMSAKELPAKLNQIKAYKEMFKKAYGSDDVTMDKVASALASFQRTLTSKRSRFDRFLDGDYKAMTDQEVEGMHLFRTKARCINCHNGAQLTDDKFHNIGLTYYKRKYEDLGRYTVTKDPNDVGKFRTPSLRDVMNTSPWMHNGLFDDITGVVNLYNSGMQMVSATPAQKAADPMYPVTDPLMKKLDLSRAEVQAVVAFLDAVTAPQYKMQRPEKLPRD